MKLRYLFLSCLFATAVAPADEYELKTGAKTVPLPVAASDELKAAIRNWPIPDVESSLYVPQSLTEWQALIENNDSTRLQSIERVLEARPVSVQQQEIAGVNTYRVTPERIAAENEQRLFVFLHGGAYVFGGGRGGLGEAVLIAERVGIEVVSASAVERFCLGRRVYLVADEHK